MSLVVTPQQCCSLLEILYHLNGNADPNVPKIALLTGLPGAGKSELLKNILLEMIHTQNLRANQIWVMGKTHATVRVLKHILDESPNHDGGGGCYGAIKGKGKGDNVNRLCDV